MGFKREAVGFEPAGSGCSRSLARTQRRAQILPGTGNPSYGIPSDRGLSCKPQRTHRVTRETTAMLCRARRHSAIGDLKACKIQRFRNRLQTATAPKIRHETCTCSPRKHLIPERLRVLKGVCKVTSAQHGVQTLKLSMISI